MKELYISKLLAESLLLYTERNLIDKELNFGNTIKDLLAINETSAIPYEDYARFYEYTINASKDSLFGLHQGEKFNLAALGIVGQIIQVSPTIRVGIEKCCGHFNLISNVLQIEFQLKENHLLLVFKLHPEAKNKFPLATKHLVLSSMVFAYKELEFLTLYKTSPLEVKIDFESIKKKSFDRVFNTSVELESDVNQMKFRIEILEQKIVFSDYELLQVLENVACARFQSQYQSDNLSGVITSMIYSLLNPYIPSFELIADNLNMSPRNLQRKLKEEGTSYSKLVTEVKKKLAVDYLKKNLSIKEVSYLMGYSESGTFVSAFKKWYGKTPGHFKLLL
ncbi:AraC family transcriptional regulator [uncultured Maribacter sp.]|uniref:AraC family transcriptional regulator n=1 Tax=uncultured Maribacter sp. TaxID=431308 RepID=UPI002639E416|nr:AraC family transcriptional regulator [uncultured Maribacter sp.]